MKQIQYIFLSLFLISGCAQLGISQPHRAPHDVYESLWASNVTLRGAVITVNQLRVDRLITAEEHKSSLDTAQQTRDSIKTGLELFEAGDIPGAVTALDKAEAYLRIINMLVASAEEKR